MARGRAAAIAQILKGPPSRLTREWGPKKRRCSCAKKTSRAETLLPMTHADIRYLTLRHSTPTPRIYLCFARDGRGFAPRCALKSSLLSCPPKTWTARFSRRAALVTKSALCLDRVAVTLSDPATLVIEKWAGIRAELETLEPFAPHQRRRHGAGDALYLMEGFDTPCVFGPDPA